jgi:hypothetical protein
MRVLYAVGCDWLIEAGAAVKGRIRAACGVHCLCCYGRPVWTDMPCVDCQLGWYTVFAYATVAVLSCQFGKSSSLLCVAGLPACSICSEVTVCLICCQLGLLAGKCIAVLQSVAQLWHMLIVIGTYITDHETQLH